MTDEVYPDDIINAEVSSAGVAQDIADVLATARGTVDQDGAHDIQRLHVMLHAGSIHLLQRLMEHDVSEAAVLTVELLKEGSNSAVDLDSLARTFEEKRIAATDPKEARDAERTGELARAVSATTSTVMVWQVSGSAESGKLLPVARGMVAKVGELEGMIPAVDYLTSVLNDVEAEGQTPPAGEATA